MTGKVYLVGAGPGDAGLMTLRGLQVLREADVIVYDHLASETLLNETKPESKWVDAGKYAGHHRMSQREIEALLIAAAGEGQQVVRLKGGDPFIFGRGGEEAIALSEAGIPYEVIPGVSSCYAAAAYAGIPVTHRQTASSFHVITGHEDPRKGSSSLDYATLAREEGTLVFLMGLSRLETICGMLMDHGKAADTPAAVIASGTTARQRCVTGTLREIAADTQAAGIQPPAVLVVGEVAALQPQIAWQRTGPLSGQRILVTASGAIAGHLGDRIRALGGEPVLLSLIDVRRRPERCLSAVFREHPSQAGQMTDGWMAETQAPEWLVFTSRNGVRLFFEQMQAEGLDRRLLGSRKIAVMGQGTRRALEEEGYYADLIPAQSCSASLAEALCAAVKREGASRVLMFRASEASEQLRARLDKEGIDYVDIPVYETQLQWKKAELLKELLDQVDVVTFCSASAVRACRAMIGEKVIAAKIACIGPVTAEAAEAAGMTADGVADPYDLSGLAACLCRLGERCC